MAGGRKPWLSPPEQVAHLKSKGVRFDLMSEEDAVEYLSRNNNYFRLRSYRTGFPKVREGRRAGQYINLDFKMLVDLSIVDMLLRKELLSLSIDVEHFAKVKLLGRIEREGEDGYEIISDFCREHPSVHDELDRGRSSVYIAGLLDRYANDDLPAWAFMEVISFGTFCQLYRFCAERFSDQDMRSKYYLLMGVKSFRNACAHNNCVLNDLRTDGRARTRGRVLTQELARVPGIGKSQRIQKMRNERISQIVTVLFMHRELASPGVRDHAAESLARFVRRMRKHLNYYRGADSVSSTFDFISKVIAHWYPLTDGRKENA